VDGKGGVPGDVRGLVSLQLGTQPADRNVDVVTGTPAPAFDPPPLLSLIVPAYNEGQRLGASLRELAQFFRDSGLTYELLVVDDGSTDDTPAVIAGAAAADPALRAISYSPNRGKGHAVRTGMLAARGEFLMFTDADLSIPIVITTDFLAALRHGYDIAIASRWHPDSSNAVPPPLARRVMGSVFRWCVRRLVISDVRDTQCGCKAYRGEVARRLFAQSQIDRFSFDAEVIFLAARAGYRIKEVPFALHYIPGSSVRPLRDSLLMLRDLVRIRLNAARGVYGRLDAVDLARRAG
jgi:dolichyl-phosphate beta-glucosyltransferase